MTARFIWSCLLLAAAHAPSGPGAILRGGHVHGSNNSMAAVTPHGKIIVQKSTQQGGKASQPLEKLSRPALKAVVANFQHRAHLQWLGDLPTDEVGTCDPPMDAWAKGHCGDRGIGESLPWLEWMRSNFDDLPTYVAFLHGDQVSWHSELSVGKLIGTKPDDVEMLSGNKCIWPGGPTGAGHHSDLLYNAFFGKTLEQAWYEWGMNGKGATVSQRAGKSKYRCCSEMVVNSDRIRNVGKPVLEALITLIKHNPGIPWGYSYEAFWQNLFSKDHEMRPRSQILDDLHADTNKIEKMSSSRMGLNMGQMVRGQCDEGADAAIQELPKTP